MKRLIINRLSRFAALLGLAYLSGCSTAPPGTIPLSTTTAAQQCFEQHQQRFSEVLACYRSAQAALPLQYVAKETTQLPGVEKRRYELTAQSWSPDGMVTPASWQHEVEIYIPANARPGKALLVANNGTNIADTSGTGSRPQAASDFTETMALNVARQTGTIVISVSNVPNQYLTYADDGIARREDSSVAHSWTLFLQAPATRPFMSVHVPMMASIVKTMDLAQQELQPWKIQTFIAAGASKRAWGSWLATIADTRIEAIVPFVIDILGMEQVLEHTRKTYGGNWPLAFGDYQREGITVQRNTNNFDKLVQIEDPLRYLDSAYAARLAIPKYLVNASGDDFFVPDNTQFYLDQLPGVTALRVAPNSSHYGIKAYVETSLITFINRLQHGAALPTLRTQWIKDPLKPTRGNKLLQISFSETPVKVQQWSAVNPAARDFRFACGIRYQATPIMAAQHIAVQLSTPASGWKSAFVEAQFADGFVITTPVRILPETYPEVAPPESGAACKTIADRP